MSEGDDVFSFYSAILNISLRLKASVFAVEYPGYGPAEGQLYNAIPILNTLMTN